MTTGQKFTLAWRFARRELRGGLRGFRIFLACLALGVAAIAAVGSVRAGIAQGLSENGAALLGGDAEIELTYRFATEDERAWMEERALDVSEVVDFRSMAVVKRGDTTARGLTQVKSVDGAYPLVGTVTLSPDMSLETAFAGRDGQPGAVMQQVLIDRLGLSIGQIFSLGTRDFVLMAALAVEPDGAAGGFGLGPRTLVQTVDLEGSGLIQAGTLFSTKYRLQLPVNVDLEELETEAAAQFADSGHRWSDSRNGAPGVGEFVDRIGAFLILVGLSGLAVGGVGVSSAVRAYLSTKTGVIATLKTIGADRDVIFLTYFFQIAVLAALGVFLGLVLGAALPLLFGPLIAARLPIPAEFTIYFAPLTEAAIYGILAASIFTLWPLARTENIRASALFRDAYDSSPLLPARRYLIAITSLCIILLAAAVWFSGTAFLTLWTAGGIVGALALLALSASLIKALAGYLTRTKYTRGKSRLRLALGSIAGPREQATSVVLSLGLGLSVLAAVGQIDGNLRQTIAGDLPDVAPSYFFVDIQNDQLPGFLDRLSTDIAVRRVETAPMLRGVISQINGRPAKDVAGDHWVLQGDRGVTYADALPDNTRITSGDWWGEGYIGPAQISFAAEEAEEMGLVLGDILTVNILGRDITAEITSFREVDFSNAGIGFILSMNPGALAGAPHTHIATVYAEEQAEAAILRDLAGKFPNITAIRVRDAIERVSDVLKGLAAATSYGAAATLVTGFLVLIGSAAAGVGARTYEAAILKTLGATRRTILQSFMIRSLLLGAAAGSVALLAGCLGGWAVSRFIMNTDYSVIWTSALAIVAAGVVANLIAGLVFALGPLEAKPAQVLRARE